MAGMLNGGRRVDGPTFNAKKKIYVAPKSGRKANKDLVETGFALGALKIGASLVRPAIVELIKSRLMGVSGRPRTNK